MAQINYKFAAVPNKLMRCLDVNCRSMLFALVDLHSVLSNEDGWFFRSNADLQIDSDLSENLVRATLDTLYQAGIINIFCVGKGLARKCNRIHINFESFSKYERYSFNDIRFNPNLKIKTVPYKNHYKPSYLSNEIGNEVGKEEGKKVSTNIDTIDTINTIDTLNTKENKISKECNKEISPFEKMLDDFIDKYSSFNYNLDNQEFLSTYYQYILDFQTFIRETLHYIPELDSLVHLIKVYARTGSIEEYQEVGKTA